MDISRLKSELTYQLMIKQQQVCINLLKEFPFLLKGPIRPSGSTTFHFACYYGLHEVVSYLVENEVDIHETDHSGENALFYVLDCPDQTMFKKIHQLGVSLNATNRNGNSILMEAISHNATTIIPYLIENGADVNHENKNGDSFMCRLRENYNKGKRIISMDFLMKHYDKFNEENQKELKKLRLKYLVEKGEISHGR